jgi:formate dehydrogenase major subunit
MIRSHHPKGARPDLALFLCEICPGVGRWTAVFARAYSDRGCGTPGPGKEYGMKSYVRLTEPMVREGGKLRKATWDEALDRAAEGFRKVGAEHGGEAIGLFSCSKATNEVNYLAQKFARAVLGTNNIDSCNRT